MFTRRVAEYVPALPGVSVIVPFHSFSDETVPVSATVVARAPGVRTNEKEISMLLPVIVP